MDAMSTWDIWQDINYILCLEYQLCRLCSSPIVVQYFLEHQQREKLVFSYRFILLFCFVFFCHRLGLMSGVRWLHGCWSCRKTNVCVCICISISHFKHSAELHTWFRAVLYFLGLSMHLSLSSGGSTFPSFCLMSKADIWRGIVLAFDRHVWVSLAIHHCSLADS